MSAGNKSETKCMGVIFGSLTIISAPMCFPNLGAVDTTLMIVPAEFYIAGDIPREQQYPINGVRFNGRAPMKSLINYAVVNVNIPGIMLEPFEMEINSTLTMAAMFVNDKMKIVDYEMNLTMGVVPGADKKAAGMKFLSDADCDLKFNARSAKDPTLADSVPNSNMVCTVKADNAVPHKSFDPIPPGYPCDSDAGAPLVVNGEVVGILVKAFCEKEDDHLAVFQTMLEENDVDLLIEGHPPLLPIGKDDDVPVGPDARPPNAMGEDDAHHTSTPNEMAPGKNPSSDSQPNFNPKMWHILQAIILTFGIKL